jgi:flagellar biosynthetic protein FliR
MGVFSLAIPYFYMIHVLVVAVRVGAALLFAPLWGYAGFPTYFRIVLVFSIAVALASVIPFSEQAYLNPLAVLPAEFIIGLLLSMGIRIAFAGLHFGGHLVSHFIGYSMVQTIDPTTANRSSVMSGFLSMFGYVIILATNQHHAILRVLASSYTVFPAGTMVQTRQWFDALMQASTQIFVIGWKIALPVFIATMLIELTVGFIARMQPQINTMIVAAPLKLYVGMLILGASLVFFPRAFGDALNVVVLRK